MNDRSAAVPRCQVSVVIPTAQPDREFGRRLHRIDSALKRWRRELLVVDDGNRDGDSISHACADVPHARVVRNPRRRGQQRSTLRGVAEAGGEVVVTMDDDHGHPVDALPGMVEAVFAGADLVYGVPEDDSRARRRRIATCLNRGLFRIFLGHSGVTSYRAFVRPLGHAAVSRYRSIRRAGVALPPNLSALLLMERPRVTRVYHSAVRPGTSRSSAFGLAAAMGALAFFWAPLGLAVRAMARVRRGGTGRGTR